MKSISPEDEYTEIDFTCIAKHVADIITCLKLDDPDYTMAILQAYCIYFDIPKEYRP